MLRDGGRRTGGDGVAGGSADPSLRHGPARYCDPMVTGSHRRSLKVLITVLAAAVLFIITALPAGALTVTFVRHGESEANASHTIDNSIPGAHLTPLGQAQSAAVADALIAGGVPYDAIYASNMVRTTETAAPFAAATGLTPTVLPGFREINAGWFEGWSDSGPGGIGYVLAPALWTLGLRSVPVPGGADGNAFDERVDQALQLVEESAAQNPVVFSHAATIMFWTMMNVDNPDLLLMLTHRLQNTDVVVVDGSTEEGWTLTSWAGRDVGPASLGTKLFVNVRDLVVTPQAAVYDVAKAFRTGDIRTIAEAVRDGIGAVLRAPVTFATAVVRDVAEAVTAAVRPRSVPATDDGLAAERIAAAAPDAAAEPSVDADESAAREDLIRALRSPEQQSPPVRTARTTRTAQQPALRSVDEAENKAEDEAGDTTEDPHGVGTQPGGQAEPTDDGASAATPGGDPDSDDTGAVAGGSDEKAAA